MVEELWKGTSNTSRKGVSRRVGKAVPNRAEGLAANLASGYPNIRQEMA